jgi:hypothetical protein
MYSTCYFSTEKYAAHVHINKINVQYIFLLKRYCKCTAYISTYKENKCAAFAVYYWLLPLWRVHEIKRTYLALSCILLTWFIYKLNTILYEHDIYTISTICTRLA